MNITYPIEKYLTYWRNTVFDLLADGYSNFSKMCATPNSLVVQTPPPSKGDLSIPLFRYTRVTRSAPSELTNALLNAILDIKEYPTWGRVSADGAYLNIRFPSGFISEVMGSLANTRYGVNNSCAHKNIMIEFSSPNTNKPLHLGHLRNNALGASLANILEECGASVRRVNLINNRGIHICKSMAAYMHFGNNSTPQSAGRKPDHFVGDWYVRYTKWEQEDPHAIEVARRLLAQWEDGDPEVIEIWKKMNGWAQEGLAETYRTTGIYFNITDYESDTYLLGKEEVLKHKNSPVIEVHDDGSLWVDCTDINLDRKVVLRADGTSLYITQDIGTIIQRYHKYQFDRHIYVVASEQQYHFKVLFEILYRMGYSWASRLYHRSYGMVFLPDGKMKSREGTVVDADDLIDRLANIIEGKIKRRDIVPLEATATTSLSVAISALHYWLLKVEPNKDITFDIQKSISFSGNSGLYILYVYARIASIFREAEAQGIPLDSEADITLLTHSLERSLIIAIARFPLVVKRAAQELDPSYVCAHLYQICKLFSKYYHTELVVDRTDISRSVARIALCKGLHVVLNQGCKMLAMPLVEKM